MIPSPLRSARSRVLAALPLLILLAPAAGAEGPRALSEAQLVLVGDAAARAVDHVRAARARLAERQPYTARLELAHAGSQLDQALAASPATSVSEKITRLAARLEDPSDRVDLGDLAPVLAALEATGDPEAWAAPARYVDRARYQIYLGRPAAAAGELMAAVARVPWADVDAPLVAGRARVSLAMMELQAGRYRRAAAVLAEAEDAVLGAVRVANGDTWSLPDVAAGPPGVAVPAVPALEPRATESEIAPPRAFHEPADAGPPTP